MIKQVRIWGGGGIWGPSPPPNLNFEAQIFAATVAPLRDVGKISLAPPYTNPGSAPVKYSFDICQNSVTW